MTRRIRVRVNGRAAQSVEVRVPGGFSGGVGDDATAAVPLALLLAMRYGDDLEVAGRIDPELHARLDLIQSYYHAMDPSLTPVEVHVAGLLEASPPAAFAGACLSRGVDSLYVCARGPTAAGPIDCAVFVDRLEPIHDAAVRKAEIALARQAAEQVGLPLVLVEAPGLRTLTDGLFDWEDAVGAGLAWIAHNLAGGLARFVVPSTDSLHAIGPCGTSPILDPLFSSGRVSIEHADVVATRLEKVEWLARNRPELLPLLKVCFAENRTDNCGRCPKCLYTVACLRVAGALEQATGFPPELDLAALDAVPPGQLSTLYEFSKLCDAASEIGDRELAGTLSKMLERVATVGVVADQSHANSFRTLHSNAVLTLARRGRPDPYAGTRGWYGSRQVGLLRTFDRRARRHAYTTSGCSAESLVAELGALMPPGVGAEIKAWILADGRLVTDRYLPEAPGADIWARLGFCIAPLRSSGHSPLRRFRLAFRRSLDAWLLPALPPARVPKLSAPAGCLFEEPGANRLPLWSGVHPVVGDQVLTWSRGSIEGAGYVGAALLGYVAAVAPYTGQLGTVATPVVPWAGAGQPILDSL
jgi:hypothetical protein